MVTTKQEEATLYAITVWKACGLERHEIWSDESGLCKAEGDESPRFLNRVLFRAWADEPQQLSKSLVRPSPT